MNNAYAIAVCDNLLRNQVTLTDGVNKLCALGFKLTIIDSHVYEIDNTDISVFGQLDNGIEWFYYER